MSLPISEQPRTTIRSARTSARKMIRTDDNKSAKHRKIDPQSPSDDHRNKFGFSIDRGGTFTDIYAELPDGNKTGQKFMVMKLLSRDDSYADAPREGIRRILEQATGIPHREPVDSSRISYIRMGTTVATNALLERTGERIALVTTKGFRDLLHIGNQARPNLFDLRVTKPELLYEEVIEVDERVRILRDDAKSEETEVSGETVMGTTGEKILIQKKPDLQKLKSDLQSLLDAGINCLAVALIHSFAFPNHEEIVRATAKDMGFTHVSCSSSIMPMVKIVPRGFTACADAYLTPKIQEYVKHFISGFDNDFLKNVKVQFMQSDGGLTSIDKFNGFRAVLSGPAGGVVGYAKTTYDEKEKQPVIGFDMGGTSTDVSRYDGKFEHIFENTTAGIPIQAPQLDINTVAAGGGSILKFESGLYKVGPESAGARPGPACYRNGGPLTITDANLICGRILPHYFPKIFGTNHNESIDKEASRVKFQQITDRMNKEEKSNLSVEEVAYGFLRVANEAMCRPIRVITQAKGYDPTTHVLATFGGAGGQHACAIARTLGISTIFIHRFSSILSAYGMGLANVVYEVQEACAKTFEPLNHEYLTQRLKGVADKAVQALIDQDFTKSMIETHKYLNLRFEGTDTALMVEITQDLKTFDYVSEFMTEYKREYGFVLKRKIVVDDVRCRGVAKHLGIKERTMSPATEPPKVSETFQCYFDGKLVDTSLFLLDNLRPGHAIDGPAMILDNTATIIVEPKCTANITEHGHIKIFVHKDQKKVLTTECDPILLSIFGHRFMSIAEQMGRILERTSISVNIKERLDFSCAIFGPDGALVANAPHMPAHLGAMQRAVQYQIENHPENVNRDDVILSNHPIAGGSHLPDMTTITPVFSDDSKEAKPVFYVASRGHHADIGGISPGSMPPFSKYLYQEGAAIVSFKLVENGVFDEQGLTDILMTPAVPDNEAPGQPKCLGTRNLSHNISDIKAQVSANNKGIILIRGLIQEYSWTIVKAYMRHIQDNAERAVRDMLKIISIQKNLGPVGTLKAIDYMDDGSPIQLAVTINRETGDATFDFTGTGPQTLGNCNAPIAITYSSIIYCLRCLVDQEIPLNHGCLIPITLKMPNPCLLNPLPDAAVVGGNVLTSQRIVDVILKAFEAVAASQGDMNNLTFGDDSFGYYETVCGGSGAGPDWHGTSGVHTHMTNTRITDPEILERRYPVQLLQFSLRPGSGGAGRYKGGDGVVRDIKFLRAMNVGILSERRSYCPYGLKGGEDAKPGKSLIIKANGTVLSLGAKNTYFVSANDRIQLRTAGGGGWGYPDDMVE